MLRTLVRLLTGSLDHEQLGEVGQQVKQLLNSAACVGMQIAGQADIALVLE